MDGLALDMETVDGQLAEAAEAVEIAPPADPWLARRALGFGASDVPALLLALGGVPVGVDVPKYIADRARLKRVAGVVVPRIIAEKAGLVSPLKAGTAAAIGTNRERELLWTWRDLLVARRYYDEAAEGLLLPETVTHADSLLKCCWPLVDRHAPMLSATLDAWCRDGIDSEIVVELKCSATARRECPWHWRVQVLAQLAVTGAAAGIVVCGEEWAAWHGNSGMVRAWRVGRDEAAIEAIRAAARQGWQMVERARETR
jgi:hypothetical protein